jgi:hypothetical protein
MRRRSTITTGLLAVALASLAVAASASAVTSTQLQRAHWGCVSPLPVTDEVHCAPPGGLQGLFTGSAETVPMLVFDDSGQTFLGTEINIRGDIFHGQPCPADPPTHQYTYLFPVFGIDYYACHHFDSDHT